MSYSSDLNLISAMALRLAAKLDVPSPGAISFSLFVEYKDLLTKVESLDERLTGVVDLTVDLSSATSVEMDVIGPILARRETSRRFWADSEHVRHALYGDLA